MGAGCPSRKRSAWKYRFRPAVRGPLRARQARLDPAVTEVAGRARSACTSGHRMLATTAKNHNQVIPAVGRERMGFTWGIARTVERRVLATA